MRASLKSLVSTPQLHTDTHAEHLCTWKCAHTCADLICTRQSHLALLPGYSSTSKSCVSLLENDKRGETISRTGWKVGCLCAICSSSKCGCLWAAGPRELCWVPSGIGSVMGEFYKCDRMVSPPELGVGLVG